MKFDIKSWDIKSIAKEVVITVVLVIVFANIISHLRRPDLPTEHLPDIKVRMIDSKTFSTASLQGKPVMIHFWATWCPVCKTEIDNIDRIAQDFEVLSVAVKSGSDKELKTFMKEHDLDFKVYNDTTHMTEDFDVEVFPTTYIFDSDGELAFTEVGYTSTLGLYLRMWWAR